MSWLDTISHLMGNVGRGAEDLFSLGGTEVARKFGGQGAKNVLNPLATGLGSNFASGALGGSGIAGANALGGASAMTPYMPTSAPNMGMAGSTLGGGMSSPLNMTPTAAAPMAAPAQASQGIMHLPFSGGGWGGQPQPQVNQRQQLLGRLLQAIRSQQQGGPRGI